MWSRGGGRRSEVTHADEHPPRSEDDPMDGAQMSGELFREVGTHYGEVQGKIIQ